MPLRLHNSNAASGLRRLGSLVLVLAVLPLVVGCPTEVPYQPTEDTPALESDSSEPTTAPDTADEASSPSESLENSDQPPPPAPSKDDRYATPADGKPARMPWETDQPTEAAPEAERLFADAGTPAEPGPEAEGPAAEEPEEEEAAETDDGFGDFLGDAYADLLDKEPAAEPPAAEPEPSEPGPTSVAVAPASDLGSRYEVKDLFPSEPTPESEASEPPAAAEPTTIELEDPVELDNLWADEPVADDSAEPTPEPTPEPEPSLPEETTITPEETLPFGSTEEPSLSDEAPEPEPAEPVETLPEPPATDPEVATEPEPALDSLPPRESPLASSAIDPLPAVPVLPFNTRHLAWLLGAKYGLAELADLDGATPDEVAEWSSEVDRLARELRINTPPSARESVEPAERVGRMMRAAARTGEALASEHGVDHAALMEISLKTNALLVVADKRPDLAGPVARAVRDAADRALLPRFLWDQTVRVLEGDPTPEEALDAINGLHERVESFLR